MLQNRVSINTKAAVFMCAKLSETSKFFGVIAVRKELRPKFYVRM